MQKYQKQWLIPSRNTAKYEFYGKTRSSRYIPFHLVAEVGKAAITRDALSLRRDDMWMWGRCYMIVSLWAILAYQLNNSIYDFISCNGLGLHFPRPYLENRSTPQKGERFGRALCWLGCRIVSSTAIDSWQLFHMEIENVRVQHKRSNKQNLLLRGNILR